MADHELTLELFEARLGLVSNQITSLRETVVAWREGDQRVFKLNSDEVLRRLEALNHEAARIAEIHTAYVPRESYETFTTDFAKWRDAVNTALAAGAGRQSGLGTAWGVAVALGGIIIAGAALYLGSQ